MQPSAATTRDVLWLSGAEVERLLSARDCIDVVERVMVQVSRGNAVMPLRRPLRMPGGDALSVMSGWIADPPCFGLKLVSLFPGNPARGLPSHVGLVILQEAGTGQPVCVLNGDVITRIRTAAASAVATRHLARPDATVLAVLGTGAQAHEHVRALAYVREFRELRVWGRTRAAADELAAEQARSFQRVIVASDVGEAIAGAHVVCTTTAAREPFLSAALLEPGMHVNAVGSSDLEHAELHADAVPRCRVYVDSLQSTLDQAAEIGEALRLGLISTATPLTEIGAVVDRRAAGRASPGEITLYKSLGIAAQDLAAASFVYDRARHERVGTRVPL